MTSNAVKLLKKILTLLKILKFDLRKISH